MLKAQSLSCRRGNHLVFRDLSFTLDAGNALLVTGANGSGKSSLLRILAGLLNPVAGTVMWRGTNIVDDSDTYRGHFHYIGHLDAVKQELTVGETLEYWQTLHGIPDTAAAADPFGIQALRDKLVRYLSAGQKRRLALSRLTLNAAPLWLLDEPLTALDRQGQAILADCIVKHRASGGIAVIASHQEMALPDVMRYEMKGGSA